MKKLRTLRTLMTPSSQQFGASSHGGLPTTSVSSKGLKPPQPPDNRLNANWKLLLQIAQHAGGGWPEQARRSAIYLSRAPYEPSVGVQLPAVLRAMFTKNRTEITSEQAVQKLLADPNSPWHEYRGHVLNAVLALTQGFDDRIYTVTDYTEDMCCAPSIKVSMRMSDVFSSSLRAGTGCAAIASSVSEGAAARVWADVSAARPVIAVPCYAAVAVALGIGWLIGRTHRPL